MAAMQASRSRSRKLYVCAPIFTPWIVELIFAKAAMASLWKVLRVNMFFLQYSGDRLGDDPAVKTAVFDENFIGVHSGDQHAGQIHSGAVASERIGVGIGPPGFSIAADAVPLQDFGIRAIAGHGEDEVVADGD